MLEILRSSRYRESETAFLPEEPWAQDSMSTGKDTLGDGFDRHAQLSLDQVQSSMSLSSPLEAFKRMARQLREQIEFSLSHPIVMLGVAHPVFFGSKDQDSLRNAVREAGLIPSRSYEQTTSQFATAAGYRVRLCKCPMFVEGCSRSSTRTEEMILYIDYTEFAITVVLYKVSNPKGWNDGGISYIQRTPKEFTTSGNDLDTGGDLRQAARVTSAAQIEFWNKITEVLRDMKSKALQNRVDYLVLSGNRAADEKLHDAITSGLGEGFHPPVARHGLTTGRNRFFEPQWADPLLAAAQGVADLSWRIQMRRTCMDPCSTWRYHVPQCLWTMSDSGASAGSSSSPGVAHGPIKVTTSDDDSCAPS